MTSACAQAIALACIRHPLRRGLPRRIKGKSLCTKSIYYTQAIAEAALAVYRKLPNFIPQPESTSYYCRHCKGWHIGRNGRRA